MPDQSADEVTRVPRCFLAVPVEEPALQAAAGLLGELRDEFDGVRWVRPEGVHLTVHFFGPLPAERWDGVIDAVGPASAAAAGFELCLGGLGAFPRRGAPRVLWLGAAGGAEPFVALVRACLARLAGIGVEVDAREPALHCTLGRPRHAWDAEEARRWRSRDATLPPFTARRVALFESLPGPGGSTYAIRREVALGG